MRRRGKTVALSTAAVAVLSLAATVFAMKDWLLERWYLHQLETGSREEMEAASARLARLPRLGQLGRLARLAKEEIKQHPERGSGRNPGTEMASAEMRALLEPLLKVGGLKGVSAFLEAEEPEFLVEALHLLLHCGTREKEKEEGLDGPAFTGFLEQSGSLVPAFLPLLAKDHVALRLKTVEVLGAIDTESAVPALLGCLRDEDEAVRMEAREQLHRSHSGSERLIAAFTELSRDRDPGMRLIGVELLRALSVRDDLPPDPSVAALVERLADPVPEVRTEAVESLGQYQERATKAVPALADALVGADENLRDYLVRALRAIGRPSLEPMITALSHKDSAVRLAAASVIQGIENNEAAIPGLIRALEDRDREVRYAACDTLGDSGPAAKAAAPALLPLLDGSDDEMLAKAAWALMRVGGQVEPLIPVLTKTVHSADGGAFLTSILTLAQLGPRAAPALTAVEGVLEHESCYRRLEAANTIGYIREDRSLVLPELGRAVVCQRPGWACWDRAAVIFHELGPGASPLVPDLIAALNRSEKESRRRAAYALRQIRGKATEAIPALREALNDPDREVRREADDALRVIEHEQRRIQK